MVISSLLDSIGIFWILFGTIIGLIVYKFQIKSFNYFTERNVKFVRGLPILGAQYKALFLMEPFTTSQQNIYNKYPNERFVGSFEAFGQPGYMIRDPELIKQMGVRDFDHFVNHIFQIDESSEPTLGTSLFFMRDQRWRNMRATLSPAFTGSKMRLMFGLIVDVCQVFTNFLKSDIPASMGKDYDIKEIYTKLANDAIASCAFGMTIDSFKDENNEFYKSGQVIANFDGLKGFKFIGYAIIPEIMNFFKIPIMEEKEIKYFRNIVKGNMNYREQNNIIRNDMIHLLLEAKKGTLEQQTNTDEPEADIGFTTVTEQSLGTDVTKIKNWNDDDLLGQCLIFFVAGFGTVSQTLSFATHAIAVHPHVQKKLFDEIQGTKEKLNGKPLTYEALQKMKYLDMIMSETLRKWAQVPSSDRYVNKPYVIENNNGVKVQLKVGDVLQYPIHALHMDPKYFPNPNEFDPERFNDDNKHNIVPGTYFPFGVGPRSCIASRFALMECKAVLYHLVSEFYVEKCDKTQHPIKIRPAPGTVDAEKGFWVRLRPRN